MKLENVVNSIKKFLGTSLLVGTLTIPFLVGNVYAKNNRDLPKKGPKVSFSIDLGVRYEPSLVNNVKNVPVEIRAVEKHPEDKHENNFAPIEADSVKPYVRVALGGKCGGKIYFNDNIGMVLGINLDFVFSKMDTKKGDYREANSSGLGKLCCDPGPEPVTGIYYYIYPAYISNKNKIFRPSFYSEIEAKVSEIIGFGLGYEISMEKIAAEKGWDRSGELEAKERYDLADLIAGKLYASLKYSEKSEPSVFFSVDFGLVSLLKKELIHMGKQMDIDFNEKDWFAGFRIGKRF